MEPPLEGRDTLNGRRDEEYKCKQRSCLLISRGQRTKGVGKLSQQSQPSLRTWRGSNCLSGALSKLGGPLPLLLLILMTCCDGSLPLLESTKKWSGTVAKRERNQRCQGFVC